MKIFEKFNIFKFLATAKSRFLVVATFSVITLLTLCLHLSQAEATVLPNCSTIVAPNFPVYATNCTLSSSCQSAQSSIATTGPDGKPVNCKVRDCHVPLFESNTPGESDIPNVTCMLPKCPTITNVTRPSSSCVLGTCNTAIAETNCSLPICSPTLEIDSDAPMKSCSLPPCSRPTLLASDQPGINCSMPICPNPLGPNDIPRVTCLLPRCNATLTSPNVNCNYRPCYNPIDTTNDRPEINCSLPICSQPLGPTDKPGENCALRICHNRTNGITVDETPGFDCALPECSSLGSSVTANPGINCVYKSPVTNKLVPICNGTSDFRNHKVNCMDMTDLPICTSSSGQIHGKNCINSCTGAVGEKPGINCMLPDCDSNLGVNATGVPIVARPGRNCLFSVNDKVLPLCKNNTNLTTKQHRINCADVIDLPLCRELRRITAATIPTYSGLGASSSGSALDVKPGVNCVEICSDLPALPRDPSGRMPVRGIDFAVHNTDCTQFCPSVIIDTNTNPDTTTTSNDESKCTPTLCHQTYGAGCSAIDCDLLTPEELNDAKFKNDQTKTYCTGTTKCYNFKSAQLPYVFIGQEGSSMCVMNNCKPASNCSLRDDTKNIEMQGGTYTSDYRQQFYGNSELDSQSTCKQQLCIPVLQRQYRCPNPDDNESIDQSIGCDKSGPGALCNDQGYCYKTVDCNNPANASQPECDSQPEEDDSDAANTIEDVTKAWFFRPVPMDIAYRDITNRIFRRMDTARICYSKSDMTSQPETRSITLPQNADRLFTSGWGANVRLDFGLFTIPLGYFHSALLPDHTRSPPMCVGSGINAATKVGVRGFTTEYLCGNRGFFWNKVSDSTAYFMGYTQSEFQENDAIHRIKVCLRFKNLMRPDDLLGSGETCGSRESAISCAFGMCLSQIAGEDACKVLTVSESNPRGCIAGSRMVNDTPASSDTFKGTNSELLSSPPQTKLLITGDYAKVANPNTATAGDSDAAAMSASEDCMKRIGKRLRLRAVMYGRYICSYVDAKGPLAYNGIFLNGSEKLFAGTENERCMSGDQLLPDGEGKCHGYDTNRNKGSASMWRTLIRIPYIKNNIPSSYDSSGKVRGYLDFNGRLFREQECIRAPLRVAPPRTYNLANSANSYNMFAPPLYILNSKIRKDGANSIGRPGELGPTDFHYPEIEVKFGNTIQKLNLDIKQTGYETTLPTSSYATINSGTDPVFTVEVLVRKEFNNNSNTPSFCLYRRVRNVNGAYIDPIKVQCVQRQLPEINGSVRTIDGLSDESRRLSVLSVASSTSYNPSSISMQFIAGSQSSYNSRAASCRATRFTCVAACSNGDQDCINTCYNTEKTCANSCTGNSCSFVTLLANSDPEHATCTMDLERHQVCVQREYCSQINYECLKNEVDLQQAKINGQDTATFEAIRQKCSDAILPKCNKKFGIDPSENLSLLESGNLSSVSSNAYGWYNEICVVSGFETKIRKIIAKTLPNAMGKCLIDPTSPDMQSGGPGCSGGGLAPGCKCLEYVSGQTLEDDEVIRPETPHEAGLCAQMPKPKTCGAINYNIVPNTDVTDVNYVRWSMSKDLCLSTGSNPSTCSSSLPKYCGESGYSSAYCIHLSHQYRKDTRNQDSGTGISPHAEFPLTIVGMDNISGTCKGFWKNKTSSLGASLATIADCQLNSSGTPTWKNLENDCIRYTCPAVLTNSNGMKDDGTYDPGFTLNSEQAIADLGRWNGFATWNSFTKTSDMPERVVATECIPGFMPNGASLTLDSAEYNTFSPALKQAVNTEVQYKYASLFGLISGYSGGTKPVRYCNQLGNFTGIDQNSECDPVQCPAINPPIPNMSDSSDPKWLLWQATSSATFNQINASRSKTTSSLARQTANPITITNSDGSTRTTYCREDLGFYQLPGSLPPTLDCDYEGNWINLRNPCAGQCSAITTENLARTIANGFAYWSAVSLGADRRNIVTTATNCISDADPTTPEYVTSPYPPEQVYDATGILIDNTTGAEFNRTTRACQIDAYGRGNWGRVIAPCVNSCPSGTDSNSDNYDSRIGNGITQHHTYNKTNNTVSTVLAQWPKTIFGQWAEVRSPYAQGAVHYTLSSGNTTRPNAEYVLKRYCNPTSHKWDNPVAACSTNLETTESILSGTIPNTPADAFQSIAVDAEIGATCASGYAADPATPAIQLVCNQATVNTSGGTISPINQTYFDFASGSPTCKKTCSVNNGDAFDSNDSNTVYNGNDKTVVVGQSVDLSCDSTHSLTSTCGAVPSGSTPPRITCQPDGTWSTPSKKCVECTCHLDRTFFIDPPGDGDTSFEVDLRIPTGKRIEFYISQENDNDDNNCAFRLYRNICTANQGLVDPPLQWYSHYELTSYPPTFFRNDVANMTSINNDDTPAHILFQGEAEDLGTCDTVYRPNGVGSLRQFSWGSGKQCGMAYIGGDDYFTDYNTTNFKYMGQADYPRDMPPNTVRTRSEGCSHYKGIQRWYNK